MEHNIDLEMSWIIACILHDSALSRPIIKYVNKGKIYKLTLKGPLFTVTAFLQGC
jgi:hypothetical protein